jgi:hypothetical protein
VTFACTDFGRFLVCHSKDLSSNKHEENPSVAICGGSFGILTGLKVESYKKQNINPFQT